MKHERIKFKQDDTYLVDEVRGFDGPSLGQIGSLDLYLLGEHHVSNLLAAAANIGSPTKHELIADYAECKIVDAV